MTFKNKYILEKLVKLKKEISVVITRFNGNNKYEIYEPIENTASRSNFEEIQKYQLKLTKSYLNQSKEWAIHDC